MDELYNITSIMDSMNSGGSYGALARSTNIILGGYYFGWIILAIVAIIMFLYLKKLGWQAISSITTTMFVDVIVAIFLLGIGLINAYTFWGLIAIFGLTILGLFLSNRE